MNYLFLTLAFLSGVVLPLQVGLNIMVGKASGNAIWAAAVSFVVGSAALLTYLLSTRQVWPGVNALAAVPAYAWGAGLFGAFYVSVSILAAPKIGAAMLITLVVAGQMVAALALDHYGALGFPQHSVNWGRIIGAMMVVGGVVLIRKY
jgi:transporter family-2 protein